MEQIMDIKTEIKVEEDDCGELPPPPPPLHLTEQQQDDSNEEEGEDRSTTPKSRLKASGPGRPLTADRKRPYPCAKCPSKFGSKMELEEHQNSHTGDKPFECDICHSRFNRRSTLWNHKRIHSDTKPFNCPVCNMTFKWKNSLKCHKDMHMRKNELDGGQIEANLRLTTYAGGKVSEDARRPPSKRQKKALVSPDKTQTQLGQLEAWTPNLLDTMGNTPYAAQYGMPNPQTQGILSEPPAGIYTVEQQEQQAVQHTQQHSVNSRPSSGSACSNISSDNYSPPTDPTPTLNGSYCFSGGNTTDNHNNAQYTTANNQTELSVSPPYSTSQNRSPSSVTAPAQSMLSVHVIASPQQGSMPSNTPQQPTATMQQRTAQRTGSLQLPTVPFTAPLSSYGQQQVQQAAAMQQVQQMYTTPMGQQVLVGGDYLPNVDYVLNPPYAPTPTHPHLRRGLQGMQQGVQPTAVQQAIQPPASHPYMTPMTPYVPLPQQRETVMVDGSFIVKVWPSNEW